MASEIKKVRQLQRNYNTMHGECMITITEWQNGDGFDIEKRCKASKETQRFSLTFCEWDALAHAWHSMHVGESE